MQKRFLRTVPKYGDKGTGDVRPLQLALQDAGCYLGPAGADDDFGDATLWALQRFQKSKNLPGTGVIPADGGVTFSLLNLELKPLPEEALTETPAWLTEAYKSKGKRESDPAFNKKMSGRWKIVGLGLKTIVGTAAAWCGLFVAVSLTDADVSFLKNGAGAKNWMKYGQEVSWKQTGIPQGAVVQINHNAKCGSSKGNHVAFANGSCSAADLAKPGAYIALFGGNQGNSVNVTRFPVAHICAVRWPAEVAKPATITESKDCATAGTTGGSTR